MSPATNTASEHSTAPERSLTQRRDALERANEVRTKRAQLKRDLKGGRCLIHTLLMDPPAFLETAKLGELVLAVPSYGRVKVGKVLKQCRISPSKTIGGLSRRQRDEVVELLRVGGPTFNPAQYARGYRVLQPKAVHAQSGTGGPLCGARSVHHLSTTGDGVTCLTCLGCMRRSRRAGSVMRV